MRYYPQFDVAIALQMNTEDGIWEQAAGSSEAPNGHADPSAIRERLSAVVLTAVRRTVKGD